MRYVGDLITQIRRHTRNADTAGIPDELLLQYLNDAQDRLQSKISALKSRSRIFVVEKEIDLIAGQYEYQLNDRLFYNKSVQQVEYSVSGLPNAYRELMPIEPNNRSTDTSTWVDGYYRRFGRIYVSPIPAQSGAKIKVSYERSLDDLDKRRGVVQSVSGLTSTGFTSLVVDSTADETSTPNLSTIDYVCICDKDGAVTAYNIPVGSYVAGTNTLTPAAGFTFQSGETIAAGSYITFGKWSSTHPRHPLPDECERYLFHYCAEHTFHKDSSTDLMVEGGFLARIESDILEVIGSQTDEKGIVPLTRENIDLFI